ncbi:MAG: hypothetical protein ACP5H8_01970 [Candidatus Micrarchaeia archaeon]
MIKREHGYYPFLDSSKKAVKEAGIDTLIDEKVLNAAEQRVYSAIMHKAISLPNYFRTEDVILDIKSYAVSRVIVSLLGRRIDAYVEAESKRALDICRKDKSVDWLMSELGIILQNTGEIPLNIYLRLSMSFEKMGISNRIVRNGYVSIDEHEKTVLLKEAIKQKIYDGLPIKESLINNEIKARVGPIVDKLSLELALKSPSIGRQSTDIAPCMQKIMEELGTGAKTSHIRRWALGVFLIKRGWDMGRIVEVFSHAPNFNEKTTRYQLEHIKSKGYVMPSCASLKSQGICVANCGIKNPLQYKKPSQATK